MNIKEININDYDYQLNDEQIAKFPHPQRDHSKLLIYDKGNISQDVFHNITQYLPERSLLVFNNTKVIQARIYFQKETGSTIEIFLLEPYLPSEYETNFKSNKSCVWKCMIGNLKKWKGQTLSKVFMINEKTIHLQVKKVEDPSTKELISFEWDNTQITFAEIIDHIGQLPIPPYLNRQTMESDKETYQTVYSKIKGSVAAPTAGLHFTQKVLQDIKDKNIKAEELTLHVGAGTFKPIKTSDITQHEMHTEYISITTQNIKNILSYMGNITAVGTTSVRTLESIYYMGLKVMKDPNITTDKLLTTQWEPYEEERSEISAGIALQALLKYMEKNDIKEIHTATQIMIAPGYHYKIVDRLITNFHQPKSTLLLLISAFVKGDWKSIYQYATANDFRFLSYGDSSLLIPSK